MQSIPELFRPRRRENAPLSFFEDFDQLQRRMDRLMRQMPESFASFEPSYEVEDRDSHYILSFDLPGVKKEDIRMTLENNQLTVSAERKDQGESKRKGQYRSQQFYGSYERSFSLPPEVKANQIESDYHNGVLRVAIPKTKALQGETLRIGDGKTGILSQAQTEIKEKKLN